MKWLQEARKQIDYFGRDILSSPALYVFLSTFADTGVKIFKTLNSRS